MVTDELKPGALASVPLHGVCQILRIEESEILGQTHRFMVLQTGEDEGLLKVPADSLDKRGIRPLLSAGDLESVLEQEYELETPSSRPHQRMKFWKQELKSGDAGVRKKVLQCLRAMEAGGTKLSKDEAALKERIYANLQREIEAVLGLTPVQADDRLSLIFEN